MTKYPILLILLYSLVSFSKEVDFFEQRFANEEKEVVVTVLYEQENTTEAEFITLLFKYFKDNISSEHQIDFKYLDPQNVNHTSTFYNSFKEQLKSSYVITNTPTVGATPNRKRLPSQEAQNDQKSKIAWNEFNNYYSKHFESGRKGLIITRGIINGAVAFIQCLVFDKLPFMTALGMGSVMGLLSSGIMKYDYILNNFVQKSLLKKLNISSNGFQKFESYLRWYSLEFSVLGILMMAQYTLGILGINNTSEILPLLTTMLSTAFKTLLSQGLYEMALLQRTEEKNYSTLIQEGQYAEASKIRFSLEKAKLFGSMVWVVAALAQFSGLNFMSNIAFGTLAGTGVVLYSLKPIKNKISQLSEKYHKELMQLNYFCTRHFGKRS